MKKYPFLLLGVIGLAITFVIHMILYFTSGVSLNYMITFYIVWFVFLVIGLGIKAQANKKE